MNTRLRESLDRTLLLMRDDLVAEIDDATLVAALTTTDIVLVGDSRNLASHAAQCAYVTAALLMARSGHCVHLVAPDMPLVGAQPPLRGQHLISALLEIENDMLPGIGFSVGWPRGQAALAVCFGDSLPRYTAQRIISVNATAWSADLGPVATAHPWLEENWPCGALAAGALASTEAFKAAMHGLRRFAKDEALFDAFFAFTDHVQLSLAPPDAPRSARLGKFDVVSGGAITNGVLYLLARLLGVEGRGRIVEPEAGDYSNLNRYVLLRQTAVGQPKGDVLKSLMPSRLQLLAIPARYEGGQMEELGEFVPNILVGVDDIPTRWEVQAQNPRWLGIGATTHWAAMASYHQHELACARCLHPRDDPANGPIPTVAFVSFFAGLALACYFLRAIAGEQISVAEQYTYFSPLRPEKVWRSPVAVRPDCPVCRFRVSVRAV